LKENQKLEQAPLAHRRRADDTGTKQCADKTLGMKFRKRGNSLYLAVLIGGSMSTNYYDILPLFAHAQIPFSLR
jgi:hypothetical protein